MFDRRSYRLKGYDYSKAGYYFITICTDGMECYLGRIIDHKMMMNDIGKIACEYWTDIPKHFPNVILHEYVIMPNHVHGIIELIDINEFIIQNNGGNVNSSNEGARHVGTCDVGAFHVGTRHGASLHETPIRSNCIKSNDLKSTQNKFGKPVTGSVPVIINQYKSSVKRWCNKNNYQDFK